MISPSLTQEWTPFLTAEMLVFGLLGKALYTYPDEAWLRSLAVEGVFNELPLETDTAEVYQGFALLQEWAAEMLNDERGGVYAALRDDYTRLFIGPDKVLAPPWGSVYFSKDRLIFQEQTLQVRNWYRRFGLVSDKLHQEPDDHIGLEMIFLSNLARLSLLAIEAEDETQLMYLLSEQWEFLQEQPLNWVNPWCADVVQFSRGNFYRGLALVVKGVFADVRSMFESRLAGG
jgi:TorA maturation chaperone TorD